MVMPPGAAMAWAGASTLFSVSKSVSLVGCCPPRAVNGNGPTPESEPIAPEHLGPTSSTCVRWYCGAAYALLPRRPLTTTRLARRERCNRQPLPEQLRDLRAARIQEQGP